MEVRTFCNGQYVYYKDFHIKADRAREPGKICRFKDWDGIGPKNGIKLKVFWIEINYDALYGWDSTEIFRISFHNWKMTKLNVNVQGVVLPFGLFIRTTRDGKEIVYRTSDRSNRLGVIENLFK
jgi:hypothetical protein